MEKTEMNIYVKFLDKTSLKSIKRIGRAKNSPKSVVNI